MKKDQEIFVVLGNDPKDVESFEWFVAVFNNKELAEKQVEILNEKYPDLNYSYIKTNIMLHLLDLSELS